MAAISSNTTQAQEVEIRTFFTKLGFASNDINNVVTKVFQQYLGKSGYTEAIKEFISITASLVATFPSAAQSSSWKWSPALEGSQAAREFHTQLMESSQARLLKAIIPPNTREPVHTHPLQNVMLVLEPTYIVVHDLKDVPPKDWETEMTKPLKPIDARVGAFKLDPEPPHAVKNLDLHKTYVALLLELKS